MILVAEIYNDKSNTIIGGKVIDYQRQETAIINYTIH